MIEYLGIALLSLLLHAVVFLAAAWLIERSGWVRNVAAREFLWRSAVLGGMASAVLQLGLAVLQPSAAFAPRLQLTLDGGHGRAPAVTSADAAQVSAFSGRSTESRADRLPALSGESADSHTGRLPALQSRERDAAMDATTAAPALTATRTAAPYVLTEVVYAALPLLLGIWLALTSWHWLRLLLAARALQRLKRGALPLEATDWLADAAALAQGAGCAAPELRVAPQIGSPLAAPGGSILLPVWALSLAGEQRRALLAHELAHLQRRDPQWRLLLALWRGLLWPLPLSAIAVRRLETLAEFQCDAAAARALGDGRPLAECLACCLQQRLDDDFPAFAVAMAAPRSPLLHRAERLLEGVHMSTFSIPLRGRLLPLAAVVAAVLAVPAFVVPVSVAAEKTRAAASAKADDCDAADGTCTSVHRSNDTTTMSFSSPGRSVKYRSDGEVRFNTDGTAVESLGAGATASVQERAGGVTRKVEYSSSGGVLQTRYWRDGKEQTLDEDGRAWLARMLPQLLREAAIDVPARVARLYRSGGAAAAVADIALIESDYSRGRHLSELLAKHRLASAELDLALVQIGRIGSDYEKRQVLSATLNSQQVDPPQLIKVLDAAADIGSDYERSELLVQSAGRASGDAALRKAWLDAAQGIGSDYERRRSLEALLQRTRGDAALLQLIDAATGIGSDFEHRELLRHIADKAAEAEAIAVPYARAAAEIDSDYERREALLSLVRAGKLQRAGALAVLDAAAGIDSDFECRSVLVELVRVLPDDAAVRERLLQVASRLSTFEREQVEAAAGLVRG